MAARWPFLRRVGRISGTFRARSSMQIIGKSNQTSEKKSTWQQTRYEQFSSFCILKHK